MGGAGGVAGAGSGGLGARGCDCVWAGVLGGDSLAAAAVGE